MSLLLAGAVVDNLVQQGFYFYVLTVSKHLSKVEWDLVRWKLRFIVECNKVKHELTRLAEFDRNIAHQRIWVQDQTRLEMGNIHQITKKWRRLKLNRWTQKSFLKSVVIIDLIQQFLITY